MNKKTSEKALHSLDKARSALRNQDAEAAQNHAANALELAQYFKKAWLIFASIYSPKKSSEFPNRALKINAQWQKARKGMRWAGTPSRIRQQASPFEMAAAKPCKQEQNESTHQWVHSFLFSAIVIFSVGSFWLGTPTLQAQASVQKSPGPINALPKPTATPTPTLTPIPTPTPTSLPTATADTFFSSFYYHSWDIPEEVSGSNDFWIEVDLSNQMLFAYRGSQIISSFYVSTGTRSNPTVTGTYKIYSKLPTNTMIGPGYNLPDVPYTMFFHKGYSIHGTYWHNNFGTPMSHGCVNMNTSEAAWVYEQATIGTFVVVHY